MPLPHPRAGGKVAFQPASCYSRGLCESSPLCPVYIFHITYEAMSLSLFGGLKKKKIAREAPSLVQSTSHPGGDALPEKGSYQPKPEKARALHRVTQLSVAQPSLEPLRSYRDPLKLPCLWP